MAESPDRVQGEKNQDLGYWGQGMLRSEKSS